MILSDRDLTPLVAEFQFETSDHQRPFNLEEQLRPCSIDLRLDRCFWVLKKRTRRPLDLRSASPGAIEIRRLFNAKWLHDGEGVSVRPGEMILGRTFEKFTIPNGYAGKLEGRSTYARLGLSVHCTGDFINPGWRGHMPLQLVNHGNFPITLTPYMRICQLLVMQVSSQSIKPYGSDPNDMYHNDEGGPSKYWLDKSLAGLRKSFGQV